MARELPKKYKHAEAESKWQEFWEDKKVYQFDTNSKRENNFIIDTPPPTVSGSLHIGHVFSYTQTDIIARHQRMLGKNIFYPMGWDDNGLPTERRVQNLFGIKCDPYVEYDSEWKPAKVSKVTRNQKPVSRKNFLEACQLQTAEDEVKYEALWRNLGLSVDWNQTYETVNDHSAKVSQYSFLDLVDKGYAYNYEAPTMWDTGFQTALAQAEVEDREKVGHFYDIEFKTEDGEKFVIATTRPELLAACIAVAAHPDDDRFKHLFGKKAITPLFEAPVPIMPNEHSDPEKGTGIMMICTFGDVNDVEFWKKERLPLKQIISKEGKLEDITFGAGVFESQNAEAANLVYSQIKGLYIKEAKKKMKDLLGEFLIGELKETKQAVKFYEKGDFPLEFITSRQWFVKILENKEHIQEMGKKVTWYPEYMHKRFEQWTEGLNQDWCIGRQRFFGVPFPVWYPLDDKGNVNYEKPLFASKEQLPIDPQVDAPAGFTNEQRNAPNGFVGDPDVMDTWATSSVSPQISSHWGIDDDRHKNLFPADLRPQAHEIIRTWAFYTVTKSWMHEKDIPWKNIAISGWVVTPDKKKISKSKGGHSIGPEDMLKDFSADALRYWAGRAKLGQDTIFDESVFKIGQRLVTKIFNASKFVMLQLDAPKGVEDDVTWEMNDIVHPIDVAWTRKVSGVVEEVTEKFAAFDYASSLSVVENLFWEFCDYYVELVKWRTYKQRETAGGKSALASLEYSLSNILRLFAPYMPYITEEVWSWYYAEKENAPSIHKSLWPTALSSGLTEEDELLFKMSKDIVGKIRAEKTSAHKNLKWPVSLLEISGKEKDIMLVQKIEADIQATGNVEGEITYGMGRPSGDQSLNIVITLKKDS
jgi:valyl-tRNA synthetase